MTDSRKQPCVHKTRKGKACRIPAIPGTTPPACRHHWKQNIDLHEKTMAYYANSLSDEELKVRPDLAANPSLKEELALARIVLSRLMARLNDPAYVLLPEDLRRLAGLIFTGARTVAFLLTQESRRGEEIQTWLAQALSEFSGEHDVDL